MSKTWVSLSSLSVSVKKQVSQVIIKMHKKPRRVAQLPKISVVLSPTCSVIFFMKEEVTQQHFEKWRNFLLNVFFPTFLTCTESHISRALFSCPFKNVFFNSETQMDSHKNRRGQLIVISLSSVLETIGYVFLYKSETLRYFWHTIFLFQ